MGHTPLMCNLYISDKILANKPNHFAVFIYSLKSMCGCVFQLHVPNNTSPEVRLTQVT